jgi:hypothetical protein
LNVDTRQFKVPHIDDAEALAHDARAVCGGLGAEIVTQAGHHPIVRITGDENRVAKYQPLDMWHAVEIFPDGRIPGKRQPVREFEDRFY